MWLGRESPGRIAHNKKSLSTIYRFHRAMRSTAANKMLITVPNKPLSLYQPVRHSLTWRTHRHEGVVLLINLSCWWAKLAPHSHNNPAPQLFSNELKVPSACSLAMVYASPTNPRITLCRILQTIPLHLSDGNPPIDDEVAETLLEIP